MPASMTDYLESKVLQHIIGEAAFTQPSGLYLAAFSVAPGETGGGTELTGNNYARQAITFEAEGGDGVVANSAQVQFAASGGDWSEIIGWGIMDASSGGNMLYYQDSVSHTVLDGATLTIAAGQLVLTQT